MTEHHPNRADHPTAASVRRRAARAARLRGAQAQPLTEPQRQIYQILLTAEAPLSAYQILERMDQPRRAYPQTVYRGLSTLLAHGLVHKLESANAFLPCIEPGQPHHSIHLLCEICGSAEELVDAKISDRLYRDADRQHFRIQQQVVELRGVCAACDHEAVG